MILGGLNCAHCAEVIGQKSRNIRRSRNGKLKLRK